MKKIAIAFVALFLVAGTLQPVMAEGRGGVMGFIAGCCFGPRTAAAYNEGKEVHWRQWCRLIPYVGIVFNIWDGIDGANGVTTSDYAAKYGSTFY